MQCLKNEKLWPYYPLKLKGSVKGNLQQLAFDGLKAVLPSAFEISANGTLGSLTDMNKLKANVNLNARTYNLGFITAMLEPSLMKEICVPNGIGIKGNINVDGQRYATKLALTEGRGSLNIDASVIAKTNSTGGIDLGRLAYDAKIQAKNVQAKHFLPKQDLYAFSGNIKAKGVGTDFLSPSTRLSAKAQVSSVHYGKYKINNVLAIAHVAHGKVHADVDSKNQFLTGLVSLDALTNTKKVQATIKADVRQADLYLLQLVEKPMKAALCGYMDVNTDLKDFYNLQASVGDITLRTANKVYRPVDVLLDVFTRKDTTHAIVDCGDFHLNMDAHGGYKNCLDI